MRFLGLAFERDRELPCNFDRGLAPRREFGWAFYVREGETL